MREITIDELKKLQSENKKILLDFYGVWCGPCKSLMPRLEKIKTEYTNIEFLKMDIDKNRDFIIELGISSVPTVMFFDGNKLINRSTGVQLESFYREILKNM